MSFVTRGASAYCDEAVAALGVVLRIVTIGSNVVFGYMKGFQPMASFNYGAKNYGRVRRPFVAASSGQRFSGLSGLRLHFPFPDL